MRPQLLARQREVAGAVGAGLAAAQQHRVHDGVGAGGVEGLEVREQHVLLGVRVRAAVPGPRERGPQVRLAVREEEGGGEVDGVAGGGGGGGGGGGAAADAAAHELVLRADEPELRVADAHDLPAGVLDAEAGELDVDKLGGRHRGW